MSHSGQLYRLPGFAESPLSCCVTLAVTPCGLVSLLLLMVLSKQTSSHPMGVDLAWDRKNPAKLTDVGCSESDPKQLSGGDI